MKLLSGGPVYKTTYDLLMGIFEFTKNFSKEYKNKQFESSIRILLLTNTVDK